jgi:predicted RNA-binding Zn ribbon-like protein
MNRPRLVKDLPAMKARFWRDRPLSIGAMGITVHPYLEPLFGSVTFAAHKLNTPAGLLKYVTAFANEEEKTFLPRVLFVGSKDGPNAMAIAKTIEPELSEERIGKWRARLRAILEAAVKGRITSNDPDFNSQPDSLLQGVSAATKGQIEWSLSAERGAGLRIYGNVQGPDAFLAVVTGMLLEQKNRELLGLCSNVNCKRLFVKRSRRVHCSTRCMKKAHDDNSPARQRNVYNRRRAAEVLLELLEERGRTVHPESAEKAVRQAFKFHPDSTYEQLAEHAEALLQSAKEVHVRSSQLESLAIATEKVSGSRKATGV